MASIKYLPLHRVAGFLAPRSMTHEEFINSIVEFVVYRLTDVSSREQLMSAKITYGAADGVRGVTYFNCWLNGTRHVLITISTIGEESPLQICGTVLHELGHVLAGSSAGHGTQWKAACHQLGLVVAEAAGQAYAMEHFADDVQGALMSLTHPNDGRPVFGSYAGPLPVATRFKPCPLGIGVRGGKSRGKGSGSRLRKYVCDCGQIVRASTDQLQAHCDLCGSLFKRQSASGFVPDSILAGGSCYA